MPVKRVPQCDADFFEAQCAGNKFRHFEVTVQLAQAVERHLGVVEENHFLVLNNCLFVLVLCDVIAEDLVQ